MATSLAVKKAQDPLEVFAQQLGRPINIGEKVVIPEQYLGIDPQTKLQRSKYAAKKALKHLTDNMFSV